MDGHGTKGHIITNYITKHLPFYIRKCLLHYYSNDEKPQEAPFGQKRDSNESTCDMLGEKAKKRTCGKDGVYDSGKIGQLMKAICTISNYDPEAIIFN